MAEEAAGIVALGVQIALKIAAYARERGHWRALALAVMQEFDELRWMIVEDVAVAKGALKMIKNPKGPEKGLIKKLSISVTALSKSFPAQVLSAAFFLINCVECMFRELVCFLISLSACLSHSLT